MARPHLDPERPAKRWNMLITEAEICAVKRWQQEHQISSQSAAIRQMISVASDLMAAASALDEANRLLDEGDDVSAMLLYAEAQELRGAALASAKGDA